VAKVQTDKDSTGRTVKIIINQNKPTEVILLTDRDTEKEIELFLKEEQEESLEYFDDTNYGCVCNKEDNCDCGETSKD